MSFIFTKDELDNFKVMTNKFEDRCDEIAEIAKVMNESFLFISDWSICVDEVWGEGDECWAFGGSEHHIVNFPAEWLTMSDEEIKAIVDKKVAEQHAKRAEEQRLQDEQQKQCELEQLKRLQEKYPESCVH